MRKVKLLADLPGGLQKKGWGVELSDEAAAILVASGKATYLPADGPLKKGDLEFYNNCTPLSPEKLAALGLSKSAAKAKEPAVVEAAEITEQTNTNTVKE